ncbi:SLAM family member 5-like isoform X1 [Salarias fasciatus]|uniref:SLAM family member 5-like isoform X1 n=1 Tax=Salarias fasciatus TaxID=181472 RepID=UPI001176C2D8|nr:SLAM family member 5-like isoform X1 [Salarias fasciatus]
MIFSVVLVLWCGVESVQSSVPPVFVQKGKDVLLDVDNVTEDFFFLFTWKFDEESLSLVTFGRDGTSEISPAYTGRIDIPDNKKYSVILKNLQETDSGVYTGRVTTAKGDSTLVQHNIIVQDVVSPVQLEVNSVSNSSHSCNVTLTCSTADSHISSTFRCIDQKCDQDGGNQSKITNSSSTLQVYLLDVTVICKHRNQVSSTEDRTDIQHVCPQLIGSHIVSHGISFCQVKTVVFSAGLFLMVSALISVHLFLKLKKQK